MSIRVVCSCGEAIHADDAFSGGYVKCPQCDQSVPVPEIEPKLDGKVHFVCPHCSTRVVGKLSSVGKRSNCPVCGEEYVIPPPQEEPEPDPTSLNPRKRVELDESDLKDLPSQRRYAIAPYNPAAADASDAASNDTHVLRTGPSTAPVPDADRLPEPDITSIERMLAPTTQDIPGALTETSSSAPKANGTLSPALSVPSSPVLSAPLLLGLSVPSAPNDGSSAAASPIDEGPSIHVSLKLFDQPGQVKSVPVDVKYFLIGRGRDCHFRPKNTSVSQHHCVLKIDRHAARIRDMGSRLGTFVNGHRIYGEVILHHSDMVRLGEYRIQVAIAEEEQLLERSAAMQLSLDDFHVAY